jgi:hypothetical protein
MMTRVTTMVTAAWGTLEALAELVRCDVTIGRSDFRGLQRWIESRPRRRTRFAGDDQIARTFAAVARAALCYPRARLCLPRAAVATRLLRRRGVAATLVVGVRHTPFAAHAWVEIDRVPSGPEAAESDAYLRLTQFD